MAERALLVLLNLLACTFILVASSSLPCPLGHTTTIENGRILGNGSLMDLNDKTVYPRGLFWIDQDSDFYRGCLCLVRPCIRKCCERGEHFLESNCTDGNDNNDENFKPLVFDLVTLEPTNPKVPRFGILYGNHECSSGRYKLTPEENMDDTFFLLANGSLYVPSISAMDVDHYCIEYFPEDGAVMALVCFPEESLEAEAERPLVFTMYPIGMLLSCIFLAITLAVYALLPELRNLHGKCLMCHVSSLLLAYICLAIVQLDSGRAGVIPSWFCVTIAFMIEFTFAAAFFWLNIMCFDICWTFSGLRPMRGSTAERERKKFTVYSLYAWGCPLLLLVISLIMDFTPGLPVNILRPNFGVKSCWFKDRLAMLVYFFGPISLLLICNCVLFALTAWRIVKLRRGAAVLMSADSQRSNQRENEQKFVLYLKLFIVMGLTWVMEIISWSLGGSKYLWVITDICNTLQGLCIFFIFVWKPKVRQLLRTRTSRMSMSPPGVEMSNPAARGTIYNNGSHSSALNRPVTQTTSLMEDSEHVKAGVE